MPKRHILDLLDVADPAQGVVRLMTPRGTHHTSFAELWALSSRIAAEIAVTLPPGRIAGVLTPSAEVIASFVGCLMTGRDFVSLPLPGRGQDAQGYARQLQTIIGRSGAGVLVVEAAYLALLRALPESLPCEIVTAEALGKSQTGGFRSTPPPGHLVQFSSGTTGSPKGVRLSCEAIGASVEATLDALGVGDNPESFCSWLPLSHDMGLVGGLLGSWAGCSRTRPGYRYTLMSPELFLAKPILWMETCAAVQATVTAAPTFAYHVLSRHLARAGLLDLRSLRACMIGAEPIGADTLRAFEVAAAPHGLRSHSLCPAYGLAEATLAVSLVRPGEPWKLRRISVEGHEGDYVSCGQILDCVEVEAPGIEAGAGPVRLRGPVLLESYVPPREPLPGRWLDTGDLGVLADGELFITGRSDDLLSVAGRNLFAWELERAAAGLADLRAGDVAVVVDGRGGYAALFETRGVSKGDLDGLILSLRRRLAAVAGVGPSRVGCVPRGTLPKTPSGKIRRNYISANLTDLLHESLAYREF